MIKHITVKSKARNEFIDITEKVQELVHEVGVSNGICYIYVPHTTAAVTVNEGADPSVQRDIINALGRLIPHESEYYHREGNADAHIKATLMGGTQIVFIEEGRLSLGTWQAIYFCEFDGPRHRRVAVKILKD